MRRGQTTRWGSRLPNTNGPGVSETSPEISRLPPTFYSLKYVLRYSKRLTRLQPGTTSFLFFFCAYSDDIICLNMMHYFKPSAQRPLDDFFPLEENSEINHRVQEIWGRCCLVLFPLQPVGEIIFLKLWKGISTRNRDLVHQLSSSTKPSSKQSNNIWGLREGCSGGRWGG